MWSQVIMYCFGSPGKDYRVQQKAAAKTDEEESRALERNLVISWQFVRPVLLLVCLFEEQVRSLETTESTSRGQKVFKCLERSQKNSQEKLFLPLKANRYMKAMSEYNQKRLRQ